MSELWPMLERLGVPAVLLGVAVWYFFQRDRRSEERAERAQAKCDEKNERLEAKVDKIAGEDRQQCLQVLDNIGTAIVNCTAALKDNASAFRDLSEETRQERRRRDGESGMHPTRNHG